MMEFKLSVKDFTELRRIQKKPNLHPRRYKKVTVLIMLHQQHSVSVIEAALGLDDNTIRRYVNGFQKRGLENFLRMAIYHMGRLSEEQERELVIQLDTELFATAKSVCDFVEQEFGVKYTISGMTDLLHRLGFVYKQTKSMFGKFQVRKK